MLASLMKQEGWEDVLWQARRTVRAIELLCVRSIPLRVGVIAMETNHTDLGGTLRSFATWESPTVGSITFARWDVVWN